MPKAKAKDDEVGGPDEPTATEEWVFVGARYDGPTARKKKYAWRDPNGRTLIYSGVTAFSIGGVYEVKIHRAPREDGSGSHVIVYGIPRYTGGRAPDAAELQTAQKVYEVERYGQAQEKKDAEKELEAALAPIIALMRKQRTWTQKSAFLAYIINRLNGAW